MTQALKQSLCPKIGIGCRVDGQHAEPYDAFIDMDQDRDWATISRQLYREWLASHSVSGPSIVERGCLIEVKASSVAKMNDRRRERAEMISLLCEGKQR